MNDPGTLTSSDGETYSDGTQTIEYDIHTDEQKVDYDG